MINPMERECNNIRTELSMKENGRMIFSMGKEMKYGLIRLNIKDNFNMG